MRFPNHVSVVWDMTAMYDYSPVLVGLHTHVLFLPPPVPAPPLPMQPTLETLAPIIWPGGLVTGSHKLTDTVYHNHVWIALKGHDLGMGLIHISVPPNDLLMPKHILESKREAAFAAGEVKANGTAIACCTMFDQGIVPTPMMICGDIPLPLAGTGTAVWGNNVIVGMQWIDLVMGYVNIVARMVIAHFGLSGDLADAAPGLLESAVGLLGQEFAGYRGDVSQNIGPVSISRSGEDGAITASVERKRGTSGIGESNVRAEVRYGPDRNGNWVTRGEVSGGASVLGRGREGSLSTDRGLQTRDRNNSVNSPVSEGITWRDLSPL